MTDTRRPSGQKMAYDLGYLDPKGIVMPPGGDNNPYQYYSLPHGAYRAPPPRSNKTKQRPDNRKGSRGSDASKNPPTPAVHIKGMHVYYAGDIGRTRAIITSTSVFKKSDNWRPLQNVHELMIEDEDSDFRELPVEFESLRHLQTINIQWTRLKGLSTGLRNVPLTHANLANNRIQSLNGIECLTKLLFLDVSFNNLTALPDTIEHLRLLRQLRASGNKLKVLPDQLGNIISLVEIVVSSNQLKALPETLSQLHLLKCLDFSMNAITALPSRMDGMKNLLQLVGSCNKLTMLPHTLQYCTKLRHLFFRHNSLRDLPDFLRTLQLESLHVQQNQIADIKCPSPTLHSFLMDGNQLGAIPQTVLVCHTLTNLSMANNQLTEVPVQIRFLKNLRHLNLGHNQLQVLPAEICELRDLRHLLVPNNKLETLPLEIFYLTKLVVLSIENNEGMDNQWDSAYRQGGMDAVREMARQRHSSSGGTSQTPISPPVHVASDAVKRQNTVPSGNHARPTSPTSQNDPNGHYETLDSRNNEANGASSYAKLTFDRMSEKAPIPGVHGNPHHQDAANQDGRQRLLKAAHRDVIPRPDVAHRGPRYANVLSSNPSVHHRH